MPCENICMWKCVYIIIYIYLHFLNHNVYMFLSLVIDKYSSKNCWKYLTHFCVFDFFFFFIYFDHHSLKGHFTRIVGFIISLSTPTTVSITSVERSLLSASINNEYEYERVYIYVNYIVDPLTFIGWFCEPKILLWCYNVTVLNYKWRVLNINMVNN